MLFKSTILFSLLSSIIPLAAATPAEIQSNSKRAQTIKITVPPDTRLSERIDGKGQRNTAMPGQDLTVDVTDRGLVLLDWDLFEPGSNFKTQKYKLGCHIDIISDDFKSSAIFAINIGRPHVTFTSGMNAAQRSVVISCPRDETKCLLKENWDCGEKDDDIPSWDGIDGY